MISVGIFHREPSYFFCRFKIRYGFGVWVIEKQDSFTVIRFTRCLNLFYLRVWAFEAFLLRIPKDAFLFPVTSFHLASPLPHFSESSSFPSNSRRQLLHHHPSLIAKCRHCCPPTVPNSVQRFANTERRKYSPGLYAREAIADFFGDRTVIRSHKSWPF